MSIFVHSRRSSAMPYPKSFHASVKPIFPELRIVRAALSPGFLFRDHDLIRDGDDRVGFVVAQSGQLTARHLGREIRLAPGDATLMLMGATGGVGWRESSVLFDMLIPPAEWEARGVRPEDGLMQRLRGSPRPCNCYLATYVPLKGAGSRRSATTPRSSIGTSSIS